MMNAKVRSAKPVDALVIDDFSCLNVGALGKKALSKLDDCPLLRSLRLPLGDIAVDRAMPFCPIHVADFPSRVYSNERNCIAKDQG